MWVCNIHIGFSKPTRLYVSALAGALICLAPAPAVEAQQTTVQGKAPVGAATRADAQPPAPPSTPPAAPPLPGTAAGEPAPVETPAALLRESVSEAGESPEADTSLARKLFSQGVEETDQDRWERAAELFRRSLLYRPSPVTTYNLASALGRVGRIVEATELLRGVVWDPSVNQTVKDAAKRLLDSLMPKVGWLTIRVEGDPDAAAVTLDARPLTSQKVGFPLPVDPGRHVIAFQRSSSYLETRTVDVKPGASRQETVEVRTPRMPAPSEVACAMWARDQQRLTEDKERKSGAMVSPWLWIVPGVVVAGAVVAGILWAGAN